MNNKLIVPEYVKTIKNSNLTIDQAVEKILEENYIFNPPINVFKIANDMGFNLYMVEFKDNDIKGIMVDSNEIFKPFRKKRIIAINKKDYNTRQLFTVAHELGHFILHCNDNSNFYERYLGEDSVQNENIEKQANFFAASLLMPSKMVDKLILGLRNENYNDDYISNTIAQVFNVSLKSAQKRLVERTPYLNRA